MIHYNFDPATGLFIAPAPTDLDPLESAKEGEPVYALPAHATYEQPPAAEAGQAAVFRQGAWELVPDHRGLVYWLNGEAITINEVGEVAPEGSTPDKPPAALVDIKAAKNREINAARLAANFSTFTHAGKVFSCDMLSRSDIDGTNGSMTLTGQFPPNWPGGWKAVDNTYIPITTRAQWEAFYLSFGATGAANFAHSQTLKAALAAATTAEQVAAITW